MKHRLWCNGDCVWKNVTGDCVRKSNKTQVNCGGHSADKCQDCPKVKDYRMVNLALEITHLWAPGLKFYDVWSRTV